jgi:very-short-patch-repair endonuclease
LLGIKSGQTYWGRRAYRSRVDRKSADFVICDKQKIEPLLVIELDDSSHSYYKRQERDEFIDDILKSANLEILHVKTSYSYNTSVIKQSISDKLGVDKK